MFFDQVNEQSAIAEDNFFNKILVHPFQPTPSRAIALHNIPEQFSSLNERSKSNSSPREPIFEQRMSTQLQPFEKDLYDCPV